MDRKERRKEFILKNGKEKREKQNKSRREKTWNEIDESKNVKKIKRKIKK